MVQGDNKSAPEQPLVSGRGIVPSSDQMSSELAELIIQAVFGNSHSAQKLADMTAIALRSLPSKPYTPIDLMEVILCMNAIAMCKEGQESVSNSSKPILKEPVKASIELVDGKPMLQCWTTIDASDVVARLLTDREMALLQRFFDGRRELKKSNSDINNP